MPELFSPFIPFLSVYAVCWYLLSLLAKRQDIADIAWGLAYVLIVSITFYVNPPSAAMLFVGIPICIWGLRLSYYIFKRLIKKTEDHRYAAWRKEWGSSFYLRSFLQVFLLQALLVAVIITPFTAVVNAMSAPNILSFAGLAIWVLGFFFESVADYQLHTFLKKKKRPAVLDTGLWKYSRHPNYFGESTMWWGLFVAAYSFSGNILAIASPLLITFLLLFVSGIPLLEKKYDKDKAYQAYKKKTSPFIPWPPKKL